MRTFALLLVTLLVMPSFVSANDSQSDLEVLHKEVRQRLQWLSTEIKARQGGELSSQADMLYLSGEIKKLRGDIEKFNSKMEELKIQQDGMAKLEENVDVLQQGQSFFEFNLKEIEDDIAKSSTSLDELAKIVDTMSAQMKTFAKRPPAFTIKNIISKPWQTLTGHPLESVFFIGGITWGAIELLDTNKNTPDIIPSAQGFGDEGLEPPIE